MRSRVVRPGRLRRAQGYRREQAVSIAWVVIIGVGAGLTTAIMLGIGRLLIWCWHRREQTSSQDRLRPYPDCGRFTAS